MDWHHKSLPTWLQYKNLHCDVLQGGPYRQTVPATLHQTPWWHTEVDYAGGGSGLCNTGGETSWKPHLELL